MIISRRAFQIFAIFLLVYIDRSHGEVEHKVHNIVLYPEKHSWCQVTPIQQVVASPGYESVTIDNSVCVGACFSYSIPKTEPAEPGELIGPYCDSCQPANIKCYHVNLYADNNNIEGPRVLQKRVQIITNCTCQSCENIGKDDCEITDQNTQELPRIMFTDNEASHNQKANEEFPDLFDAQTATKHLKKHENDINFKDKLKKWFEVYQNETEDQEPQKKADELMEMQRNLEHNEKIYSKIEKDLEVLSKNFGVEGFPSHQKGSHYAMGIHNTPHHNDVDNTRKVLEQKSGLTTPAHTEQHHHAHHKHVLGEEQQLGNTVASLIKGPHGSLALGPPVEAKLHIDSDALQPNSEGIVIEYENPSKNKQKIDHVLND